MCCKSVSTIFIDVFDCEHIFLKRLGCFSIKLHPNLYLIHGYHLIKIFSELV